MESQYDFSQGERGKFYRPDTTLKLPIYLDPDVDKSVRELAAQSGQDVDRLVNDWLRNNVRLIHSVQRNTTD
jgi:hypothetical protein